MKLQQGHGGWNPRMTEYLTEVGNVHRITDKGDIRVQYDGCANRWTFHPAALSKICTFQFNDIITIINDPAKVQQLQKNHGEWVETMRSALGKSARVLKIYADGDLRIQMLDNGFAWTLNPKCAILERAIATERSNSMMDLSHQRTDHVMMPLSAGLSGSSARDKLVRDAAQGRLEYVQHYLGINPDQVDVMSGGKTCLQVAAHQGHVNIVKYLLALGANVNVVDKEGDSTLHYAAFGNQPEIMKILLQNNAEINVLNASHCSALHISAHKKPPYCVKILLEFGADVNIQDSYGDTALHDAIGKENTDVVELLCNAPNLDLTVRNNRGFNALHHASLKGNVMAAKKILQMARQLVDVKKDDGFSALHLAALNGHSNVVEILINEGQADINIRNNRRQTPFLLAVSQGHCSVIEKLIDLNCDILAKDEDGDNAMHLCIIKKSNLTQDIQQQDSPKIYEIYQTLQQHQIQQQITENKLMYCILCYLAKEGCQIEPNYKGARIFDWLPAKEVRDLILSYSSSNGNHRNNISTASASSPIPSQRRSNEDGAIIDQIYSNIQGLSLDESGDGNTSSNSITESEVVVVVDDTNQLNEPTTSINNILSNPPTPARRNRQQNNNADGGTVVNDDGDVVINSVPKKMNTNHPGASSSASSTGVATSSQPPVPVNRLNTMSPGPIMNNDHPTNSTGGTNAIDLDNLELRNNLPNNITSSSSSPSSSSFFGGAVIGGGLTSTNILPTPQKNNHISRKQLNNSSSSSIVNKTGISGTSASASGGISGGGSGGLAIGPLECIVCNEVTTLITFEPCYHQISCEDCGVRMKKCLTCGTAIEKRLDTSGRVIYGKDKETYRQPSADRLRYLESKILEIEETHCCSICMERRRNVAFLCGHGACSKCADTLKICHMCRKTIVKKINLY